MEFGNLNEYVRIIVDSTVDIQTATRDMDLEAFRSDPRAIQAVVDDLVAIGKAEEHVNKEYQMAHPEVKWFIFRGLRNSLLGPTFTPDANDLWKTIHDDLLPNLPEIQGLLENPVE